MSLAPEECSRRVVKDSDKSKSTGNNSEDGVGEDCSLDVTTDVHSSSDPSLQSKCQQSSQPIESDMPLDEAPADIQRSVGDGNQQINDVLQGIYSIQVDAIRPDKVCVPVQRQMSLGDAQASCDEPIPLFQGSSSSTITSVPSTTPPLYTFNTTSLLMDPSFGDQSSEQSFGNLTMTDIDWSNLQVPNGLQAQESVSSDLWFDSIVGSHSAIHSPTTDVSSSFFPDQLPNLDAQELYLPDAYPSSLLPPEIVLIGDVNPAPSVPRLGAIVPHATPLLASILDGTDNNAIADRGQGGGMLQDNPGNKRRGARKRKADNALVGMKDGGAPKTKKRHAKKTGGTAEEEANGATTGETEADRLEKEAEATQEAAIGATKGVKEAAKPGQALQGRRSGRVHTLPGHLKGYLAPRKGSRASKKSS